MAAAIAASFAEDLEKGGKRAQVGEIREFGGRKFIRTPTTWKFYGKGTGTKAKEHVKSSSASEKKDDALSLQEQYEKRLNHLREIDSKLRSEFESIAGKEIKVRDGSRLSLMQYQIPGRKGYMSVQVLLNDKNEIEYNIEVPAGDYTVDSSKVSSLKEIANEYRRLFNKEIKSKQTDVTPKKQIEKKVQDFVSSAKNELKEKTSKEPTEAQKLKDDVLRKRDSEERIHRAESKKKAKKDDKKTGESVKVSFDKITSELKRLNSISEYSREYVAQGVKEKINQLKKERRLLTQVHDLSLFKDGDNFRSFLSPGPMKISESHPHEVYSFGKKKVDGKYVFDIPSDQDIEKKKMSRKETLEGVKEKRIAWWTPSGYHFGIKFRKTDAGNSKVILYGRPSSAVGKSAVFKEYEIKGWDIDKQREELDKYDQKTVRKFMQSMHGEPVKFD